jgi:hypothetical protein
MKKTLLFTLSLASFFFSGAFAQTIPNNSFENWTNLGNYDDPNGWGTFNELSSFGMPVTTTKSTDAQAGSLSISVATVGYTDPFSGAQDTMAGMAWLGQFTSNFTVIEGVPFTQMPGALTGYYKYTRMGNDTGVVYVFLSKWNTTTNSRDYIAEGDAVFFSTTSTYAPFTAPLIYNTLTTAPDTMGIWIIASGGDVASPGSTLKVDNLAFAGSAGITSVIAEQPVKAYPNPASQNVSFAVNDKNAAHIELFDLSGRMIESIAVNASVVNVELSSYDAGMYMYQVAAEDGSLIGRGKLTVTK